MDNLLYAYYRDCDSGEVAARYSPAGVSPCVEGKDSARQQVQTH